MRTIESASNPVVKRLNELRKRRNRDKTGLFVIEGQAEVQRAIAGHIELELICVLHEAAGEFPDDTVETVRLVGPAAARAAIRERGAGVIAIGVAPPHSLTDLAHEAATLVDGAIKERGVAVAIDQAMPTVSADRLRLLEVYQNLIDNAVKFMGPQPDPRIEVGVRSDAGELVCYVRDNGIGIASLYHEKIFGLFDQLSPDGEGTGIGLALVRRIVEVHGGRIWVESAGEGAGSTFCFTLPVAGEVSTA